MRICICFFTHDILILQILITVVIFFLTFYQLHQWKYVLLLISVLMSESISNPIYSC